MNMFVASVRPSSSSILPLSPLISTPPPGRNSGAVVPCFRAAGRGPAEVQVRPASARFLHPLLVAPAPLPPPGPDAPGQTAISTPLSAGIDKIAPARMATIAGPAVSTPSPPAVAALPVNWRRLNLIICAAGQGGIAGREMTHVVRFRAPDAV